MKKSLILFFAVVVVFLGAALVVQSFKQMRYKEQLAIARAESDAALRDTEALQAANERLQKERGQLRRKVEDLRVRVGPVQPAVPPASAAASVETATNHLPTKESQNEGTLGGVLTKMMEDPEMRQFIRDQQRQMMDSLYDPLMKRLGLTPEDAASFKDFLADTQMEGTAKATALLGGSATNRAETLKTLSAVQQGTEEQIKAFLGEDGYALYQDYQQTLSERMQLNQLRMQTAGGERPITDEQTELLLAMMKEEKANVAAATGQILPGSGQDLANLQAVFSGEQTERLLQIQETVNQRVYERAWDVLSPEQMDAFGRFQTNQLQMMRLGMNMAQKMFAPGGAESESTPANR